MDGGLFVKCLFKILFILIYQDVKSFILHPLTLQSFFKNGI